VSNTSAVREKLRNCSISSVTTTNRNSGRPALIEFCPRAGILDVPPVSSR
jgi:hypothetical protein